jgi:hypothetical protein
MKLRCPHLRRVGLIVLLLVVGTSCPALAQAALAGEWKSLPFEDLGFRVDAENVAEARGMAGVGGPWIGDYTGLPLNEAARRRADSWDAAMQTAREHQTIVTDVEAFWLLGPGAMRISPVTDATQRVVGLKIYRARFQSTVRFIWLDGRPHPPEYAAHTWLGFSTGTWDGNMLTVETTHLKAGWVRRNGVPTSDEATITEHFVRHGNYLTIIRTVSDPVYLEEPLIGSASWELDPEQQIVEPPLSEIVDEVAGRPDAFVPHHLPGANDSLKEFADHFGIPFDATRGGKESTYPEYQVRLRMLMVAQSKKNAN